MSDYLLNIYFTFYYSTLFRTCYFTLYYYIRMVVSCDLQVGLLATVMWLVPNFKSLLDQNSDEFKS